MRNFNVPLRSGALSQRQSRDSQAMGFGAQCDPSDQCWSLTQTRHRFLISWTDSKNIFEDADGFLMQAAPLVTATKLQTSVRVFTCLLNHYFEVMSRYVRLTTTQ
jgi:hypothetical protein